MSTQAPPRAFGTIATAFRALVRPPFRVLVSLSVVISLTSTSFSQEVTETEMILSIVLLVASIYLQIAVILAAGSDSPDPSADKWLRGAFRRRCFWRFLSTTLVVVLGLFVGVALLIVGIFLVGALLALAPIAAVLERRIALDATGRSAELAKEARFTVGFIFGVLVLIPVGTTQTLAYFGVATGMEPWWVASLAVAEVLTMVGTIALTRLFVTLGGDKTPSFEQMAPKKPLPPPR